jgi:hypothetical protein
VKNTVATADLKVMRKMEIFAKFPKSP